MARPPSQTGQKSDHIRKDTLAEQCIYQLIRARAERMPEAAAIVAPGHKALTYGRLVTQVEDAVRAPGRV